MSRPTGRSAALADRISAAVVDVPDFPQPGIVFKDLSPLFGDGSLFRDAVAELLACAAPFDVVAGIEARGFILAAAAAYAAGVGLVPVRKAGKLPRATLTTSYSLEYGSAALQVHEDGFLAGARVLIVDDVLATGGTARAAGDLVGRTGARVASVAVLVELAALRGRDRLAGQPVHALLTV